MRLIRGFGTRARDESELTVIVEGKRLCGYVLTVTDKSPKKFRFTLVSRLRNYSLDALESLYRANLVRIRGTNDAARIRERLDLQRQAYTDLKTLAFLALLAKEQGCILAKQYERSTSTSPTRGA